MKKIKKQDLVKWLKHCCTKLLFNTRWSYIFIIDIWHSNHTWGAGLSKEFDFFVIKKTALCEVNPQDHQHLQAMLLTGHRQKTKMRRITVFLELNSSFQQIFSSPWAGSWSNVQTIPVLFCHSLTSWWLVFLYSGISSILQQWVHKITICAFWRRTSITLSSLRNLYTSVKIFPSCLFLG